MSQEVSIFILFIHYHTLELCIEVTKIEGDFSYARIGPVMKKLCLYKLIEILHWVKKYLSFWFYILSFRIIRGWVWIYKMIWIKSLAFLMASHPLGIQKGIEIYIIWACSFCILLVFFIIEGSDLESKTICESWLSEA